MATSKTLRGYQADLYRRVNRARNKGKDAVMLLPTGAGKTAIARNHCSHVLNHPNHTGVKRVIITTPQKQILAGFLRTNEEEWSIKGKHSSQKIDNVEIIEIANKDIGDFLKGSSGGSIAISCIQSITNQRSNAFNPFEEIDDCSSILWVIDEAHHIEAEQTAKVIEEFKCKNGKILYLTATPFNANGALRILNNPDIEIIHRSLGEHMKDGFAPGLEMSYEMFDVSAGVQTDYNYVQSDLSRLESWATSIANAYEKDNKPKTLVVIPSFSRSGDGNVEDLDTVNAANTLKTELEKKIQGIKVLSAVGNDASGELSKAIEIEANTFPGHDIIIACRRFDEGTDVPAIGAVYLIGMTGCRRIIQLMGRALRNKSTIKGFGDKYPDYLNKSIFKFFIFNTTTVTDDDLEDNQYEFSLSAIKTINAVQNFRSYDVISGAVRVRRRLQERTEQLIDEDPDSPDIEILEELVSEIEQPIIALETSGEKDDSMLALMAHNHMDHTNEEALENASETAQAYVQSTLLSNELETVEDVEEFVERSISRKRRNRTANVINEELVELVTQYATEKVNYIESDLIKTFTTSINRNTLEEWGDVLWDTYDNIQKQIVDVRLICEFKKEHNKDPSQVGESEYEKRLGRKLTNLRQTNLGRSNGSYLYDESIVVANEYGYCDLFENIDREKIQIENATRICEFVKNNNRTPIQNRAGEEGELANRLNVMKGGMKNRGSWTVYPRTLEVFEKYEMLHILENIDRNVIQERNVTAICEFIRIHNKFPSQHSVDKNEVRLASSLTRYRQINSGSNTGLKISTKSKEIANEYGYVDLFDITASDELQASFVKQICEFIKNNNKFPRQPSDNIDERRLAQKLSDLKKERTIVCELSKNVANEYGMPNLFEVRSLENLQLEWVEIICKFILDNNRNPSYSSVDANEKKLGAKLSHLKIHELYPSSLSLIEGFGLLSNFQEADPISEQVDKIKKICEFVEAKGAIPKTTKNVEECERKLGQSLTRFRRIYKEGRLSDEARNVLVEFNCLDLLLDIVGRQVNDVTSICKFYVDNNRWPKQSAKDKSESFLGKKLQHLRSAYVGVGTSNLYQESRNKANELGFSDMFIKGTN